MTAPPRTWYFESPFDRRAMRWRAAIGLSFAVLLALVAARALEMGSPLGAALGVLGAVGFVLAAGLAWRVSRLDGAPLVLDRQGIEVDDGLGSRWRLAWTDVEGVRVGRSLWGKRVVLDVRGASGSERVLPLICQGDGPPQWLAGIIETFRQQALHPDERPESTT